MISAFPASQRTNRATYTPRENFNELMCNTKDFEPQYMYPLLSTIRDTQHPGIFREALFSIMQLYFDGLIKNTTTQENSNTEHQAIWQEQQQGLEALFHAGEIFVSGFYRKEEEIAFDQVREYVFSAIPVIAKYAVSHTKSNRRHMWANCQGIAQFARVLDLEYQGRPESKPDVIVPIANGAFEPALLAATVLGVSSFLPVRYSRYAKHDTKVHLPYHMPENLPQETLEGKNVLIIDDMAVSNTTIKIVREWALDFSPKSCRAWSTNDGEYHPEPLALPLFYPAMPGA